MLLKYFLMLGSFLAGSMIAFQSPINAKLGSIMGGPLVAAFISFVSGTIALGLIISITGQWPRLTEIYQTAPWMWVGGILGAIFVFTSISVVPVLGAALMISLFVAGQLAGALIIDKTGFLLPQSIDIGWERMIAVALILAGVILFTRSTH